MNLPRWEITYLGAQLFVIFAAWNSVCTSSTLSDKPYNQQTLQATTNRSRHHRSVGGTAVLPSSTSTLATSCPVTCQNVKVRQVCASDGKTYPSKCELRKLRKCYNKHLTVASRGHCTDSETKCQTERRTAIHELSQRQTNDPYIPECKANGRFLEMQCHNATGYCWCVTPDGKPIPGSSMQGKTLNCSQHLRGKTGSSTSVKGSKARRGAIRMRSPAAPTSSDCNLTQRTTFNVNLIKLFNEEYMRVPQHSSRNTDSSTRPPRLPQHTAEQTTPKSDSDNLLDSVDKRVVDWKFTELDNEKDDELKRKEIRMLRYMVNKMLKPRSCAQNFHTYCDFDSNRKISRHEWLTCLGVGSTGSSSTDGDVVSEKNKEKPSSPRDVLRSPQRLQPGQKKKPPHKSVTGYNTQRVRGGMPRLPLTPSDKTAQSFLALISQKRNRSNQTNNLQRPVDVPRNDPRNHGSAEQRDAASQSTCEDERLRARDQDLADPDGHIFIPECDVNGLFKKAQCHNSTGYCWCVDDKTGVPIPGISTHNVTPDCSDVKTKRLKGCPFLTKKKFLTELLDHITQEMVEQANNGSVIRQVDEPDPDQSIEERAVRWKLRSMDSNNNNVLEKNEIKYFKEEIKVVKEDEKFMRKCRRNFLQYCDEDNNTKITMDEWVSCMGLNEQPRNLPENPKRKGPNPFSTVLKS